VNGAPVVVTGATGLVGSALAERLRAEGRTLRLASRAPRRIPAQPGVEAVGWDGVSLPAAALDGAGAVVHLAGESIFGGLPTRARRERIWSSRIDSTKALVARLRELPAARRPGRLVCASAVGFYGDRGEEELTDASPPGSGFLAELCVAWEAEARGAAELGVRVTSLRFGVILSRAGGALAALSRLFGLGLGGRLGDGRQWLSWIHLDDVVGLALRALDDVDFTGAFAAVAPAPVRNEDFTRELARAVRRPALLPAPAFAVRLALGELAGELLGSRRVRPARALALGHRFAHPELASALAAELGRP
jgi:uncharacterized protein (TIGR01777 family)